MKTIDGQPLTFDIYRPTYRIVFCRDSKEVGCLDFNGPELVFTGDCEESAKLFFDHVAMLFGKRLKQERAAEREACAKICDYRAQVAGISNRRRMDASILADQIRERGDE